MKDEESVIDEPDDDYTCECRASGGNESYFKQVKTVEDADKAHDMILARDKGFDGLLVFAMSEYLYEAQTLLFVNDLVDFNIQVHFGTYETADPKATTNVLIILEPSKLNEDIDKASNSNEPDSSELDEIIPEASEPVHIKDEKPELKEPESKASALPS